MKKVLWSIAILVILHASIFGQNIDFKAIIADEETKEPLIGATLEFEGLEKDNDALKSNNEILKTQADRIDKLEAMILEMKNMETLQSDK